MRLTGIALLCGGIILSNTVQAADLSVSYGVSAFPTPLPFGLTARRNKSQGTILPPPVNPPANPPCQGEQCPPPPKPVDLAVTKTGGTTPAQVGYYSFTITVSNTGGPFTAPSGSIVITDTAPSNMSFTGISATPGWTCAPATVAPGGVLTCAFTGATVPGGVVGSISINGFVPGSGPFPPVTNCVGLGIDPASGYGESNLQNNSACATVLKPSNARQRNNDDPRLTPTLYQEPKAKQGDDWSGPYIGGQLGVSLGKSDGHGAYGVLTPGTPGVQKGEQGQQPTAPPSLVYAPFSEQSSGTGIFGGLHAGYLWSFKPVVMGFEVDFNRGSDQGGAAWPQGVRTSPEWFGSVRGRAGFAFDRFMLYATAGLAVDSLRTRIAYAMSTNQSRSSVQTGPTVGAGAEIALGDGWRGRLEYRYTSLGSGGQSSVNGVVGGHYTENSIRAGVSWSFGR